MVLVLNLGLGQRGDARRAPVDWLQTPIDAAIGQKFPEFTYDGRFVCVRHGEVRMIPVAKHAQPFKLLTLDSNETFGIGTATATDFNLAHLMTLATKLQVYLMLNR